MSKLSYNAHFHLELSFCRACSTKEPLEQVAKLPNHSERAMRITRSEASAAYPGSRIFFLFVCLFGFFGVFFKQHFALCFKS